MRASIRVVDFSKRGKDFRGNVGLWDADTGTIYVHKGLPKYSDGTRRATVSHEMAHAYLDHLGDRYGKLTRAQEEVFCELMVLVWTPRKYLTRAEQAAKTYILGGYTWAKNRKAITRGLIQAARANRSTPPGYGRGRRKPKPSR